jgi:hypothetical protein
MDEVLGKDRLDSQLAERRRRLGLEQDEQAASSSS